MARGVSGSKCRPDVLTRLRGKRIKKGGGEGDLPGGKWKNNQKKNVQKEIGCYRVRGGKPAGRSKRLA